MADTYLYSSTTPVVIPNDGGLWVISIGAWILVPGVDAVTVEAGPLSTHLRVQGGVWGGDHGVMILGTDTRLTIPGNPDADLSGQRYAIGAAGAVNSLRIEHEMGRVIGGSEGLLDLTGLTEPIALDILSNSLMTAGPSLPLISGGSRIADLSLNNSGTLEAGSLVLGSGAAIITNHDVLDVADIDGRQGTGVTLINTGTVTDRSTIWGSPRADKIVNSGTMAGRVFLGEGNDEYLTVGGDLPWMWQFPVDGGPGNDVLKGDITNIWLEGGTGEDTLVGSAAHDRLGGGAGNDVLDAGDGWDTLRGDAGDDLLRGRASDDWLIGGPGRDVMTGGPGVDRFIYYTLSDSRADATRDVITDFEPGVDLIDLTDLLDDYTFIFTTERSFLFRGTAGFTATGMPELRLQETSAGSTIVRMDIDGNGTSDMEIHLAQVQGLTAEDFLL